MKERGRGKEREREREREERREERKTRAMAAKPRNTLKSQHHRISFIGILDYGTANTTRKL